MDFEYIVEIVKKSMLENNIYIIVSVIILVILICFSQIESFKNIIQDVSQDVSHDVSHDENLLEFIKNSSSTIFGVEKYKGSVDLDVLKQICQNFEIISTKDLCQKSEDFDTPILYYIPQKWKVSSEWLIKVYNTDNIKYIAPEGLIKINKNVKHSFSKYIGLEDLDFYKFII